jgi:hypothetical protein
MTMSNGTSTSIGVRAAHGDNMNDACNSVSCSASVRLVSLSTAPGRSSRSNSRSAPK